MDDTLKCFGEKHICVGLLAHVDAGKTTLSEAMLYLSGSIRKAGRVDNGDAFLDTCALERARGITIFSKQAVLNIGDLTVTLLDTPGHVDFSAEMERTLQVLDYAVLVVNGTDGVQGHTLTLWRLLNRYKVPVFLFVNKMDQNGTEKETLLAELKERLHENCMDFTDTEKVEFWENAAMCSEASLEQYLATGCVEIETVRSLIAERKLYPVFFGSALKMQGVARFLEGFREYVQIPVYPKEFGAKVFKIARDVSGNRLTYLKVTGGKLHVKMPLSGSTPAKDQDGKEAWEEKVNQIRIYSGEKYETVEEAGAGRICAVTGLNRTFPGEGFGCDRASGLPLLEPVLTYRMLLPDGCDAAMFLPKLRQLEEEEPELHIIWNEKLKEIQVQMMGEVQIEILKSLIQERFDISVEFGTGNIVYKETISKTAEGVGHFEPLRHYAEVHLLLEPGEPGSGLVFAAECSMDMLDGNWQRLVLTHLAEKEHAGVLTGAPVTDMKITLVAGRAHLKHTEGGDFRQATYRALRQGLMQAEAVLLEPYYNFRLELPKTMVGRAMSDIERMGGTFSFETEAGQKEKKDAGNACVEQQCLAGSAPVAAMQNYQKEVTAYTKGEGRLLCTPGGYRPCKDAETVISASGYEPERDTENTADSVFCAHGAGFVVSWDKVKDYMHLESWLAQHGQGDAFAEESSFFQKEGNTVSDVGEEAWIGTEEIDRILNRTYNANKRDKSIPGKRSFKYKSKRTVGTASSSGIRTDRQKQAEEEYLLVDGYNIIFAWEELKALAEINIDGARGRLLDILSNYQGIRGCRLIVVFDAYRVAGHQTETTEYHNILVVYTKEAETADHYIEKFAHENGKKYRVTVATSDGLEQIIIRGAGCLLLSARDLWQEVNEKNRQIQEAFEETKEKGKRYLLDSVSADILGQTRGME